NALNADCAPGSSDSEYGATAGWTPVVDEDSDPATTHPPPGRAASTEPLTPSVLEPQSPSAGSAAHCSVPLLTAKACDPAAFTSVNAPEVEKTCEPSGCNPPSKRYRAALKPSKPDTTSVPSEARSTAAKPVASAPPCLAEPVTAQVDSSIAAISPWLGNS